MKKIKLLFLMLMLTTGITACGGNAVSADNSSNVEQETVAELKHDNNAGGALGVFDKNATIAETILVDENGVKITAMGLEYTNYSAELELMIENNSDKNLSFSSATLGDSCNSVNGYMIKDGYLNCDVAAGKKANEKISFSYNNMRIYGIDKIADMEVGFAIHDEDYNYTYTGPRQLKTSVFEEHDYSFNYYQDAIPSEEGMSEYGYEVKHFSKETLYDENGIKLISSGIIVNQEDETMLLLEVENTTDSAAYMAVSDIILNGLVVNNFLWSCDTVNAGKHGIIGVNLSYVLDKEYWSTYGFEEVGAVTVLLSQRDSEGINILTATPVDVIVSGVRAEHDASGKEIYNKDGLRIIFKDIMENPSEYSNDISVLLLAENNSGKELTIGTAYESLSVNGFMTDYICSRKTVKDGERAVIEIELQEDSLEENQIADISAVKEVEMGFEIWAGSKDFAKPTIEIELGEE